MEAGKPPHSVIGGCRRNTIARSFGNLQPHTLKCVPKILICILYSLFYQYANCLFWGNASGSSAALLASVYVTHAFTAVATAHTLPHTHTSQSRCSAMRMLPRQSITHAHALAMLVRRRNMQFMPHTPLCACMCA
jgi:hypothetical protein